MKRMAWFLIVVACAGWLLAGCKDPADQRASTSFHLEGIQGSIERLKQQIPQRDYYPMKSATDNLYRMLNGLEPRLKKRGAPQEQVDVAKDILASFNELRPELESVQSYDEQDMLNRLEEIEAKIAKIEQNTSD